jgi:serine/threonine protein kinase
MAGTASRLLAQVSWGSSASRGWKSPQTTRTGPGAAVVRRFVQEALLTRKLQHPNAVRVDDIDKDADGRPFIAMEFIEGRSLKALMDLGPIMGK